MRSLTAVVTGMHAGAHHGGWGVHRLRDSHQQRAVELYACLGSNGTITSLPNSRDTVSVAINNNGQALCSCYPLVTDLRGSFSTAINDSDVIVGRVVLRRRHAHGLTTSAAQPLTFLESITTLLRR